MKRKYWVLLIVCLWVLSMDLWTKHLVQEKVPLHKRVEVIPGFFNLTHVRNTGGAFGILGEERGGPGSPLFLLFSLVAIASILLFFVKLKGNEKTLSLGFSLVLGGALGNLIDRLRYGEVVDFLDFHLFSFHWPAFNIADSAICIGIGLIALEFLILEKRRSAS